MNYRLWCNGAFVREACFLQDAQERENQLIRLYPQMKDQIWEGFGGAVTDSAAYVFSLMQDAEQNALLDACFGENGLGYRSIRVPIDSCDFSLEQFEAAPDGDPAHFDLSRPLRYTLPLLEAIRFRVPGISLMLSPWSPPAVFKSNQRRENGGYCLKRFYRAWAEYICRYIREFTDRGFTVSRISLQNEPHAVQTWDSCVWTAAEERDFLVKAMKPAMMRNGFDSVEIFIWDHNKERVLDRALAVFEEEGRAAAAGIAFHWYSGDHFESLRKVHELYPEKKILLSENCIEYSKYSIDDAVFMRSLIAHEILGDLESGTNAFFDWNLVLDQHGGPNYVNNYCHAPLLFNTETGELKKQSIYDAIWHFARFLPKDSTRILSSSFSREIETTAFSRPDGSIVLILHNLGKRKKCCVSLEGMLAELTLPAKALLTMEIVDA